MNFTISSTERKSNVISEDIRHMIMFFGFESEIKGLTLVTEEADQVQRYEILSTDYGFAIDEVNGTMNIWFEYNSADKDYEIQLNYE